MKMNVEDSSIHLNRLKQSEGIISVFGILI